MYQSHRELLTAWLETARSFDSGRDSYPSKPKAGLPGTPGPAFAQDDKGRVLDLLSSLRLDLNGRDVRSHVIAGDPWVFPATLDRRDRLSYIILARSSLRATFEGIGA